MPVRFKRGKVVITATPQTAAEGRLGREGAALVPRRRPMLLGEQGAVSALALSLIESAIANATGTEVERSSTGRKVRYERARLRKLIGQEETRTIESALTISARLPLATLANLPGDTRAWLVQGAIQAASTAREFGVASLSAMASLATGERLKAIGQALLQEGGKTLDKDLLGLAAKLIGAGKLEVLNALELSRRSNEVADKAKQAARFKGWAQPTRDNEAEQDSD